jgi:CheY-like chemotaxis protein
MSTEYLNAADRSATDERARALAALAGVISHDLNNVLSAVLMAVDLLETICTREREREILSAVEESAKRGIALNLRLLRLARGEWPATGEGAPPERTAERAEGVGTEPAATESGGIILVVDGDRAVRAAAANVLEKHGYRTQTAADGAEAVALFAGAPQSVAAVVAAAALPYLDGRATLRALRRWRDVPAVLTGAADEVEGLAAEEGWATPVALEKPFTAPALLDAVRRAVAGR